jgi:FxsC-like protein
MSKPLFFFSYAHLNAVGGYLGRFINHLRKEIVQLQAIHPDEVAFFDRTEIKPGDDWPADITGALQGAKVFVPVYSPWYFSRELCGKEWQVFLDRHQAYRNGASNAPKIPPILPILWVPFDPQLDPLPAVAQDIDFLFKDKDDNFDRIYAEHGLLQLARLTEHRDTYFKFLRKFAQRLVELGRSPAVPPLAKFPTLRAVPNAFLPDRGSHQTPNKTITPSMSPRTVKFVKFVVAAGSPDELRNVRTSIDCYGGEDGIAWVPYLPGDTTQAAVLAQQVAVNERFLSSVIGLKGEVGELFEEAENKNHLLVLLIDVWTLQIHRYQELLKPLDKKLSLHAVLILLWNPADKETLDSQERLRKTVDSIFKRQRGLPHPDFFVDRVESPEQLGKELCDKLHKALARIIEDTVEVRTATRPDGYGAIAKPSLSVSLEGAS